jgi:hypothetical protein
MVLNIVLWSAKHDSKSYVRRSKEFVARLSRSPMEVSEEVKALVRNGGCMFPESKEWARRRASAFGLAVYRWNSHADAMGAVEVSG